MTDFANDLMLISLDQIKQILGIDPADTSRDEELTIAAPVITGYFENYTKRGLAYSAEVTEEFDIEPRLPLHRFPIDAVASYQLDGVEMTIPRVEKNRGYLVTAIYPGRPYPITANLCYPPQVATVTYSGGYPQDDVPMDLAHAYAHCCADFIGLPISGGSGLTGQGSPLLKTLGLGSGALSIGFETKSELVDTFDVSDAPRLLQPYAFALRNYMNRYV